MSTSLVLLLSGLVIVVLGADRLVEGAVAGARRLGASTLIIGLTVVAYGTSFPEFVVSTIASIRGVGGVTLGNVVGSNIANIGLVLGAVALAKPILINDRLLFRRDIPLLLVSTAVTIWFLYQDGLSRFEGSILASLAVVTTVWCLKSGSERSEPLNTEENERLMRWPAAATWFVVGLVGLMGGAHLMVEGASQIARAWGISERVIGLTVVAVGTSLPELAASVAGALKGHPELAVGNIVGSCIFNLTFVLGGAVLIAPLPTNFDAMLTDLAVMAGLTVTMSVMMRTKMKISRWEGILLVSVYAIYIGHIIITTAQKVVT